MTELYFLRHGTRIDHALRQDSNAEPLSEYEPYDPCLAKCAIEQMEECARDISECTEAFTPTESAARKNVFVHFSPYLRCCQSADLLVTSLKRLFAEKYPKYRVRFSLLGDFALSEWIHDKMKNKPPFHDNNDAYQMYTPNIKKLANKSAISNFRPTNSLGAFNGYDLSYKDYQARCKSYFKKLLATYDKPVHVSNNDIIIVVSHGYMVNNFMSYFINHPIFDEIPEAQLNFAKKKKTEESEEPVWVLEKDALQMVHEGIDTQLNLETDIVYYKTNFIKRDELNALPSPQTTATGFLGKPQFDKPRPSFKVERHGNDPKLDDLSLNEPRPSLKKVSKTSDGLPPAVKNYNPICPAAKDWRPNLQSFRINSDFQLKTMNLDAFKADFDITNLPSKPISPEVSPNSKPTRNNSVIDLSKLVGNDEIFKPIRLKHSPASQISVHHLNSKVNSHVNLAQYQRNVSSGAVLTNNSSTETSYTDLPTYISQMSRKRSLSNPVSVTVAHHAKDSYFPLTVISKVRSTPEEDRSEALANSSANEDSNVASDLDIIEEMRNDGPTTPGAFAGASFDFEPVNLKRESSSPPLVEQKRPLATPQQMVVNPLLNRSKSLNYRGSGKSLSLLAKYQEHQTQHKGRHRHHKSKDSDRSFSLLFKNKLVKNEVQPKETKKGLVRFIPSISSEPGGTSTPKGFEARGRGHELRGMFDRVDKSESSISDEESVTSEVDVKQNEADNESESESDDSSSDSDGEERPKSQYIWFGNNRN